MAPNSPPSLWTDRRAGGDHPWLTPDRETPASETPTQPFPNGGARPPRPPLTPRPEGRPPGRRGGAGRAVLATLAAIVVIALAVFAGTQLVGGDDSGTSGTTPNGGATATVLPAVKGAAGATRINQIYAAVNKGVVSVKHAETGGVASGTGFVIDGRGTIVTNAHVVGDASEVQVQFDSKERPVTGRVVGRDVSSDLAVVHVDPGAAGTALHPLAFADSDKVRVGDLAVAIGYPLGLDRTATAGIISGLGRSIQAPNGFSIDKVIQTDAPINPGNSGGPLLDARGRVMGVNSQIATAGGGGGNVGIGFAIPANTVRQIVPRLESGQTIARPYLGVTTGAAPNVQGALVTGVAPGGPAERAGIEPGDVLLEVDGKQIMSSDDVATAISGRSPGAQVSVTLERGGRRTSIDVTLGNRPQTAATLGTP